MQASNYLTWRDRGKAPVKYESIESIQEASSKREAERRRVEEIQKGIQKVPLRFQNKSFQDYSIAYARQNKAKTIAMRYVETFQTRLGQGAGLVFYGKPGTGKTLLSLIIYQALLKFDYRVQYESSLNFLNELIELKFKTPAEFKNRMAATQHIQFLIIDEVTESMHKGGVPSELERQFLFHLINHRYENNLPTLVITNRAIADLVARLGEPVMDRLLEKSVTLAFDWQSYRQK